MHQRVQLLFALAQVWATLFMQGCSAQGNGMCAINWKIQSIQETLPCDPLGVNISLQCAGFPNFLPVNWFWTQNVSQAGINGAQIFGSMAPYTVIRYVPGRSRLFFRVNEATVGYYWCQITNPAPVRPSGIFPVCSDSSLPQCPDPFRVFQLNYMPECAIRDSNFTIVSHSGLPTNCAVPPSPSTVLGPITHNSLHSPVPSTYVSELETAISPSSTSQFPSVTQTVSY